MVLVFLVVTRACCARLLWWVVSWLEDVPDCAGHCDSKFTVLILGKEICVKIMRLFWVQDDHGKIVDVDIC